MASYLRHFDRTPEANRWPIVRRWMYEEPLPFFAELLENPEVLGGDYDTGIVARMR